jgi:uncharacterized membrane protein YfcA
MIVTVTAGVIVGIFSAMFGVGGGLLMVPFIVLVLDESQHLAEGTSLLVIVPTALAGAYSHARRGFVSFRNALWLGVGGIGGVLVGAYLAQRLDPESLQRIFGAFVIAMSIRLIVQARRERE